MNKPLSHQEIFDKAVRGVVEQGALSANTDYGRHCRYRLQKNGRTLACGVGHLIADDLYSEKFEGCGVRSVGFFGGEKAEALSLALLFSGVDVTDAETSVLLCEIQEAHDEAAGMDDFIERTKRLATRRCLKSEAA